MAQADLLFCVPSFLVYVYSILNDICERKYNTYSSERCMHMCHLQGIILLFSPFLFIWVILQGHPTRNVFFHFDILGTYIVATMDFDTSNFFKHVDI